MTESPPSLLTTGVIATRLKVPVHRIEYVVRTRNIEPCSKAGSAYVFTEDDVERIARILHQIDSEKPFNENRTYPRKDSLC